MHEREIPHYEGKIDELAVLVARLTYDQTAAFLGALAADLTEQADSDLDRGRHILSEKLTEASDTVEEAMARIQEVWEICEPFMTAEERGEASE